MNIIEAIKRVTGQHDLSVEDMVSVMTDIMTGNTTDAQNAAFLVGLQMKGIMDHWWGRELPTLLSWSQSGQTSRFANSPPCITRSGVPEWWLMIANCKTYLRTKL